MIDVLRELVDSVSGLGFDVIKVTANDDATVFEAVNNDRTAIMKARTKAPIDGLTGVFGLSNLSVLGGILSLSSMRAGEVEVKTKHGEVEELVFTGADGARAVYRVMAENAVPKQPTFRSPEWDVTVENVGKAAMARFKEQAGVFGSVGGNKFTPSAQDGQLIMEIGEAGSSNHSTRFVLTECTGDMPATFKYQNAHTSTVLALTNHKTLTLHFSAKGVMQAEIGAEDDAVMSVNFIFPGHS